MAYILAAIHLVLFLVLAVLFVHVKDLRKRMEKLKEELELWK